MYRIAIALLLLSIPLAATPALACGMEMEVAQTPINLEELMSAIDDIKEDAIDVAKNAVKAVEAQVVPVEAQVIPIEAQVTTLKSPTEPST